MENLQAALQWLALAQQIINKGFPLFKLVKDVLRDNGIEADTSALEAMILDAQRRREIAEKEVNVIS